MQLQALRQAANQGTISLPPPCDSEGLEDIPTLKLCLKVTRQLSDFREAFVRCRNSDMIGRLMLTMEARYQVLGNSKSASLKDYFLSRIIPNPSNEDLVRMENYVNASLDLAKNAQVEPISVTTIVRIANHFLQDDLAWRRSDEVPKEIPLPESDLIFVSDQLPTQLEKWEHFSRHQRDMEPLVHLLLTSLYFVALSPLNKYNEKIGQILMQLAFMQPSLASPFPCLQFGHALRTNPHLGVEERRYGWRTQKWTPYLVYALTTISKSLTYSMDLLRAIERLHAQTEDYLKRLGMGGHHAFLEAVFTYPACRTGEFSSFTGTRRQVASHILNDLARAGILERVEDGRDRIFYHSRLIELLGSDSYAFTPLPCDAEPFELLYQKGASGKAKAAG